MESRYQYLLPNLVIETQTFSVSVSVSMTQVWSRSSLHHCAQVARILVVLIFFGEICKISHKFIKSTLFQNSLFSIFMQSLNISNWLYPYFYLTYFPISIFPCFHISLFHIFIFPYFHVSMFPCFHVSLFQYFHISLTSLKRPLKIP